MFPQVIQVMKRSKHLPIVGPCLLRGLRTLRVMRAKAQVSKTASSWGLPCYAADGMFNYGKNMAFMREEGFASAYSAGAATGHKSVRSEDLHIEWRVHIACWAARHALHLPGDFVECGVNRGFLSTAICNYLKFNNTSKHFYLFDTFNGIPEDQMLPTERRTGIEHNRSSYEECYESVKRSFAAFPRVKLIRGRVPDTLNNVAIDKVCFLSIDMNIAAPEVAAIEWFWDKLVPGAVVIFDDYGWEGYFEQKAALDAFAERKGVSIATLPTGQGLLLKP